MKGIKAGKQENKQKRKTERMKEEKEEAMKEINNTGKEGYIQEEEEGEGRKEGVERRITDKGLQNGKKEIDMKETEKDRRKE